jgi:hypothetical protein
MGGRPLFPASRDEDDLRRVGDAVHAYLGALPSLAGMGRESHADVAGWCLDGFGVRNLLEPDALVGIGERLEAWVEARYPGAQWLTEVPLSAPASAGGHWDGVVDLLLILPDGGVVVVDHKAGPLRLADAEEKAAGHAGQLAAYLEALEAQGREVRDTWIHFALGGVMVVTGTRSPKRTTD